MSITKILSGGQTGVDRGGLDAAKLLDLERGGWCPKDRVAEDFRIPDEYELTEAPTSHYPQRTALNIRDSDATLIIVMHHPLTGGTRLTRDMADRMGKPVRVARIGGTPPGQVRMWIEELGVQVLNVAGPRESRQPGIQVAARDYLVQVMR